MLSLHQYTPGWIAPRLRSAPTYFILQTTVWITRCFRLVLTERRQRTNCFKWSSKAWGKRINGHILWTLNAANSGQRYLKICTWLPLTVCEKSLLPWNFAIWKSMFDAGWLIQWRKCVCAHAYPAYLSKSKNIEYKSSNRHQVVLEKQIPLICIHFSTSGGYRRTDANWYNYRVLA